MVGSVAGDGGRSAAGAGEVVTRGTCASGDDGSWRWPDITRWWRDRRTAQFRAGSRSLSARRGPGGQKVSATFTCMEGACGRQASEEAWGALLFTVFHDHVGFNFPKNPLKHSGGPVGAELLEPGAGAGCQSTRHT